MGKILALSLLTLLPGFLLAQGNSCADVSGLLVASPCSNYFLSCENGQAYRVNCTQGLLFNAETKKCDFQENIPSCKDKFLCGEHIGYFGQGCSRVYWHCSGEVALQQVCPDGLFFNEVNYSCDYKMNVPACEQNSHKISGFITTLLENDSSPPNDPVLAKLTPSLGCANMHEGKTTLAKCIANYLECKNGILSVGICPSGSYFDGSRAACVMSNLLVDCDHLAPKEIDNNSDFENECTALKPGAYSTGCSKTFFTCYDGVQQVFECPESLVYNNELELCDYPNNVLSCQGRDELVNESLHSAHAYVASSVPTTTSSYTARSDIPTSKEEYDCSALPDGSYSIGCIDSFIVCSGGFSHSANCPVGLVFNQVAGVCDYIESCTTASDQKKKGHDASAYSLYETENRDIDCSLLEDGFYSNGRCSPVFVACSNGFLQERRCPNLLVFNDDFGYCDYPSEDCNIGLESDHVKDVYESPNDLVPNDEQGAPLVDSFDCPSDGFFAFGCSSAYVSCMNGKPTHLTCPSSLVFNPKSNVCDYNCHVRSDMDVPQFENTPVFDTQKCKNDGPVPGQSCLHSFYVCFNGYAVKQDCPTGLVFSDQLQRCEYPSVCESAQPTLPPSNTVTPTRPAHTEWPELSTEPSSVFHDSKEFSCSGRRDGHHAIGCAPIYVHCESERLSVKKCPNELFFNEHSLTCEADCKLISHTYEQDMPQPTKDMGICSAGKRFALGQCKSAFLECRDGRQMFKTCPTGTTFNSKYGLCIYYDPNCRTPPPVFAPPPPPVVVGAYQPQIQLVRPQKAAICHTGINYPRGECMDSYLSCVDGFDFQQLNCVGGTLFDPTSLECKPLFLIRSCVNRHRGFAPAPSSAQTVVDPVFVGYVPRVSLHKHHSVRSSESNSDEKWVHDDFDKKLYGQRYGQIVSNPFYQGRKYAHREHDHYHHHHDHGRKSHSVRLQDTFSGSHRKGIVMSNPFYKKQLDKRNHIKVDDVLDHRSMPISDSIYQIFPRSQSEHKHHDKQKFHNKETKPTHKYFMNADDVSIGKPFNDQPNMSNDELSQDFNDLSLLFFKKKSSDVESVNVSNDNKSFANNVETPKDDDEITSGTTPNNLLETNNEESTDEILNTTKENMYEAQNGDAPKSLDNGDAYLSVDVNQAAGVGELDNTEEGSGSPPDESSRRKRYVNPDGLTDLNICHKGSAYQTIGVGYCKPYFVFCNEELEDVVAACPVGEKFDSVQRICTDSCDISRSYADSSTPSIVESDRTYVPVVVPVHEAQHEVVRKVLQPYFPSPTYYVPAQTTLSAGYSPSAQPVHNSILQQNPLVYRPSYVAESPDSENTQVHDVIEDQDFLPPYSPSNGIEPYAPLSTPDALSNEDGLLKNHEAIRPYAPENIRPSSPIEPPQLPLIQEDAAVSVKDILNTPITTNYESSGKFTQSANVVQSNDVTGCERRPDGVFASGCSSNFVTCASGVAYVTTCPNGLVFDSSTLACNYPELSAGCTLGSSKSLPVDPAFFDPHVPSASVVPADLTPEQELHSDFLTTSNLQQNAAILTHHGTTGQEFVPAFGNPSTSENQDGIFDDAQLGFETQIHSADTFVHGDKDIFSTVNHNSAIHNKQVTFLHQDIHPAIERYNTTHVIIIYPGPTYHISLRDNDHSEKRDPVFGFENSDAFSNGPIEHSQGSNGFGEENVLDSTGFDTVGFNGGPIVSSTYSSREQLEQSHEHEKIDPKHTNVVDYSWNELTQDPVFIDPIDSPDPNDRPFLSNGPLDELASQDPVFELSKHSPSSDSFQGVKSNPVLDCGNRQDGGYFLNCNGGFIMCSSGKMHVMTCASSTNYNEASQTCEFFVDSCKMTAISPLDPYQPSPPSYMASTKRLLPNQQLPPYHPSIVDVGKIAPLVETKPYIPDVATIRGNNFNSIPYLPIVVPLKEVVGKNILPHHEIVKNVTEMKPSVIGIEIIEKINPYAPNIKNENDQVDEIKPYIPKKEVDDLNLVLPKDDRMENLQPYTPNSVEVERLVSISPSTTTSVVPEVYLAAVEEDLDPHSSVPLLVETVSQVASSSFEDTTEPLKDTGTPEAEDTSDIPEILRPFDNVNVEVTEEASIGLDMSVDTDALGTADLGTADVNPSNVVSSEVLSKISILCSEQNITLGDVCSKFFFVCTNGQPIKMLCSSNKVFDPSTVACEHPTNVADCNIVHSSSPNSLLSNSEETLPTESVANAEDVQHSAESPALSNRNPERRTPCDPEVTPVFPFGACQITYGACHKSGFAHSMNCSSSLLFDHTLYKCVPSEECGTSQMKKLLASLTATPDSFDEACDDAISNEKRALGICRRSYVICGEHSSMERCPKKMVFVQSENKCVDRKTVTSCRPQNSALSQTPSHHGPPVVHSALNVVTYCNNRKDGFYRNPETCAGIVQCFNGDLIEHTPCPSGLFFNDKVQSCDYPNNVPECDQDKHYAFQEECVHGAHIADEKDCTIFYRCVWNQKIKMSCPSTTVFNPLLSVCDYIDAVPRCKVADDSYSEPFLTNTTVEADS